MALGDVVFSFDVRADLPDGQLVAVHLNGVRIGSVFQFGASSCPEEPDTSQLVVPADVFNEAVAGRNATIELSTTGLVDENLCVPPSFVRVGLIFTQPASNDCNQNSVPDECEADFDEDATIDDCDADIDDDGIPNESDVCLFTPLGNPINEQGRSIGDLDGDCLVTLGDYRFFAICLDISGPGHVPALNDCIEAFDFDGDRDVDLRDFSVFERSIVLDPDG